MYISNDFSQISFLFISIRQLKFHQRIAWDSTSGHHNPPGRKSVQKCVWNYSSIYIWWNGAFGFVLEVMLATIYQKFNSAICLRKHKIGVPGGYKARKQWQMWRITSFLCCSKRVWWTSNENWVQTQQPTRFCRWNFPETLLKRHPTFEWFHTTIWRILNAAIVCIRPRRFEWR